MCNKKRFYIILFSVLSVIFISLILSSYVKKYHIQNDLAEHVLRLHILAASDDENDQENKLLVRDAILSDMAPYMEEATSKAEACEQILTHLDEIKQTAEDTLISLGDENTVSISLSNDYFPEKTYGEMTFPEGYYDALKICIGPAEGHNWWCVMYPSLCFIDASTVSFSEDACSTLEDQLEADTYNSLFESPGETKTVFRFKYLTFLNFLFE